ncbi:MAG: glutamate-1-semialdehyde 2,1-aminomutase, partial [bacterium]
MKELVRSRSLELYRRACLLMPAGVNSPVRAFGSVHGTPLFFAHGAGAFIEDVDGNRFLDCCGSWGPLILGHAPPIVLSAVRQACQDGMTFGAPHAGEIELAELVQASYPAAERIRFVSSGTEAVMSAVRLARGFTGRSLVVKFSGCYHGHSDALLVQGGSGLATFGASSSAGVPAGAVHDTCVVPLDDEQVVTELFRERGDEIAVVLIEPIPANAGLLLQRSEYLQFLRDITRKHGVLLLFDEVISGFRVGSGGAAARYGIEPDLVTFGKVIGGGMPVGAFGGTQRIMEKIAPLGDVYQAGTLSGNPVAMAAGCATLKLLGAERVYSRLEELGQRLEDGISEVLQTQGGCCVRVGSIFWLGFQSDPPRCLELVAAAGVQRYSDFHSAMLDRGVYLAPSGYEVGFLNHAMTEADVDYLAGAIRDSLPG